jgi:uncharacterized protein YkwD
LQKLTKSGIITAMKKSSRKLLLICGLLIALAVGVCIGYNLNTTAKTAQAAPKTSTAPHITTRAELLALVNQERQKKGVEPLQESPALDVSAQAKAEDMVNKGYFSHFCTGCLNGLQEAENDYPQIGVFGENLAEDYPDAKSTIDAWTQSPEHFKIMTNPAYTVTGFGIEGDKIVEHFYGS